MLCRTARLTALLPWILLLLSPKCFAILGSPPPNLPACLHDGNLTVDSGRYGCNCTSQGLDRQCKLVTINLQSFFVELKRTPIQIAAKVDRRIHIGLQFITASVTGNGTLLTLKNDNRQDQLKLYMKMGRIGALVNLNGEIHINFDPPAIVKNDNAWHHLDFFIESSVNDQTVDIFLMIDHCRKELESECIISGKVDLNGAVVSVGHILQMGDDVGSAPDRFTGCITMVTVQNETVDFLQGTQTQVSREGCPLMEASCRRQGRPHCGAHGVCRSVLTLTDRQVCRCQPGFRPQASRTNPSQWPCQDRSSPWSTLGQQYNVKFLKQAPNRLRISLRTRNENFTALAVASWWLSLRVESGVPVLSFKGNSVRLDKLNVSDGNWHLYDIVFTTSFMSLRVDELDMEYFGARRYPRVSLEPNEVDVVIAGGAMGTCLDDAWVDFVSLWPTYLVDYPLETNPSQQRLLDWPVTGRQQGCDPGSDRCTAGNGPCSANEQCLPEWRGYRCECLPNYNRTSAGDCVPVQCLSKPCGHGGCTVALNTVDNSTSIVCNCDPGWFGSQCDDSNWTLRQFLQWWWMILVVLAILLLIVFIILLVCCLRKRNRRAERLKIVDASPRLATEQLSNDRKVDSMWETGEKDFSGPIDYSAFPDRTVSVQTSIRSNGVKRTPRQISVIPGDSPRAHGQKTSDTPPWERFDREKNRSLRLDTVLEYGYEGYDGKAPPEFCPNDPVSLIGETDSIESAVETVSDLEGRSSRSDY